MPAAGSCRGLEMPGRAAPHPRTAAGQGGPRALPGRSAGETEAPCSCRVWCRPLRQQPVPPGWWHGGPGVPPSPCLSWGPRCVAAPAGASRSSLLPRTSPARIAWRRPAPAWGSCPPPAPSSAPAPAPWAPSSAPPASAAMPAPPASPSPQRAPGLRPRATRPPRPTALWMAGRAPSSTRRTSPSC